MRPTSLADILLLLRSGAAPSPDIERGLGLSQSTASRYLRQGIAEKRIVRLGTTKGARYALLRTIESIGSVWPLHRTFLDLKIGLILKKLDSINADFRTIASTCATALERLPSSGAYPTHVGV